MGSSAGIASFNTPLAGCVFIFEEIFKFWKSEAVGALLLATGTATFILRLAHQLFQEQWCAEGGSLGGALIGVAPHLSLVYSLTGSLKRRGMSSTHGRRGSSTSNRPAGCWSVRQWPFLTHYTHLSVAHPYSSAVFVSFFAIGVFCHQAAAFPAGIACGLHGLLWRKTMFPLRGLFKKWEKKHKVSALSALSLSR